MRPLDLVQRMAGRHQHLFRRATSVRAGAAEVAGRTIATDRPAARVATVTPMPASGAQDQHIIFFGAHRFVL
jgi:hypothetical protein